jgi:hypothetical protein
MSYQAGLRDDHYTENQLPAIVMIGANARKNQQSGSIDAGEQNLPDNLKG